MLDELHDPRVHEAMMHAMLAEMTGYFVLLESHRQHYPNDSSISRRPIAEVELAPKMSPTDHDGRQQDEKNEEQRTLGCM